MKERLAGYREIMAREGQAAAILHKPENYRYLSGYAGEGFALVTQTRSIIFTDFRYTEQAHIEAPDWEVVQYDREYPWDKALSAVLELTPANVIGFEDDFVSVRDFEKLKTCAANKTLELLRARPEVLRRVKDASEIDLLARAEEITAQTFNSLLDFIKPGISELELKAELEYRMFKLGAQDVAFPTIIASGANGSLCHAVPGEKLIEVGDLITMDFGAQLGGYKADMTRTVAVGHVDAEQRRIYDTVLEAQRRALEALKPGVTGAEVDAIARGYIYAQGYEGCFGHSLGHATGLLIHEGPNCSSLDHTELAPGMSMTCEPGIYVEGKCGVRIEDLVIITETGIRNLALSAKKELIIL